MRIILITGISGSGKSVALTALEDAGYYCVDNLPPSMLRELIRTLMAQGVEHTAIAIDARSATSFTALSDDIHNLRQENVDIKVLYLTAKTESLIARFSETRRSHPLSHRINSNTPSSQRLTLAECIKEERERLVNIEDAAHTIDTSNMSANTLRTWITQLVEIKQASLTLLFESFAFKLGVPLDADFVFDARALANPYYDPNLRLLTGLDAPVISFLDAQSQAAELMQDIQHFISKWLPAFKQNNRSYITIAIGCTGGQHRSVYLVEHLAQYFQQTELVLTRHRELGLHQPPT